MDNPYKGNSSTSNSRSGILSGLGAVLGGPVGGLVGSLASSLLGNRGAKRRQQQADRQNIKFWEMQNAYNTPKAQMGRLKDAGLNPNLIYGSNANTGIAGSVSPSKASPYNVQNPVPSAVQTALSVAQINNIDSITKKNEAETARTLGLTPFQVNTALSKADQAKQQAIAEKIKTSIYNTTKQDQINKIVEEALLAKANKSKAEAEAEYTKKMLNININPKSGLGSQINQFIFGTTNDAIDYFKSGEWKNSSLFN
jgi:hypothetical protein